jgi:uncharacterized protein (TIGR03067 family)
MVPALLALAALAGPADEAVQKELKKLAGSWSLVRPEGSDARPFTVEVAGDRLTIVFSEKEKVGIKIKIDPSTNPACIDFELENGTFLEGIYRLDGDTWKVCVGPANVRERPTAFPAEGEKKDGFAVLKRVKP